MVLISHQKPRFTKKPLQILKHAKAILEAKKDELGVITAETEKEENDLVAQAEKATPNIDERLLTAYTRLRQNAKNGLAVVTIQRDSCSGCFNQIPPQRQSDIRQRKKSSFANIADVFWLMS
jgi:predicted  nucleic acid-binding Zn-ribbon protein